MTEQAIKSEVSPEEQQSRKERIRTLIYRFGGIAFAIGVTVLLFVFREQLKGVERYGLIGIFLISVIGNATIVLPMPTFVTAFAGGAVFNPLLVAIISAAGATVGEMTGYLAGTSGKAMVENKDMYDRFNQWMNRYGLVALFVLAAIPNPFFDVAGIIAGVSKIPVTKFLVVTWAGKIVKFLIIAYLGAGSTNLLDGLFG